MPKGLTLPVVVVFRRIGGSVLRQFGRDVKASTDHVDKFAKGMGVSSGVVTGAMQAIAVTTAAAGAALVTAGAKAGVFEQSIQAAAFATEAATSEIQGLRNAALDVGLVLRGVGGTDAARALREIGAEGLSAAEAALVLAPAIDLARASFFELSPEKAGGLLVQTMRIFDIETSKATDTVDKLTRASTVSAIRLEKLNLFMGIAATGAQAFGASLTDTLAAASLIRGVIPRVERGSTALRGLFDDLADSTRQQKLETELGVKAINKQTGEFRNIFDIIMDVQSATKGMTNAQREAKLQNVFQIEAIAGLRAVMVAMEKGYKTSTGQILKGAAALAFLRNEIDNSQGATADLVARQRNTFKGGLEAMKAGLENFAIGIGDMLFFLGFAFQAVGVVLGFVGKTLTNMNPVFKVLFGTLLVGVVVAGMVAAGVLGIALAFGSLQAAGILATPAVMAVFGAMQAGILGVWAALGPVGVAIVAIFLVVSAIAAVWAAWTGSEAPKVPKLAVAGGVFKGAGGSTPLAPGGASGSISTGRERRAHEASVQAGGATDGSISGEAGLAILKQIRDGLASQSLVMDGEKVGELQRAREARIAARQFARPASRL